MQRSRSFVLSLCVAFAAAPTGFAAQNAIGFVKLQLEAGSMYLARNDFLSTEGETVTIAGLLRDQVPPRTVVHVWDQWGDTGGYLSATNLPGVGWEGAGTEVDLSPGVGFWIDLSSPGIDGGPWSLWLFGEVPGNGNERDVTPYLNLDVDLVGYPYPAEVDLFEETELGKSAPASAVIHRWDADTGEYRSATKVIGGGWEGPAVDMGILRPCEGFWLDLSGTDEDSAPYSFEEPKPYAWP